LSHKSVKSRAPHPCGFGVWFCNGGCFSFDSDLLVCVAASLLTDFNDSVASVQAGLDSWPRTLESCEERCSTTIAEANPDEFDFGVALLGEIKEIFVLLMMMRP
jgi:hypothetical protein